MMQFSSPLAFPRGIANKVSLVAAQPVHTDISICVYRVYTMGSQEISFPILLPPNNLTQ
jgi:hypothetical protein